MTPIKPESPKVMNLANHCHDLNSSDLTRRNIFVDGAWIKEQWMSIKSRRQIFKMRLRNDQIVYQIPLLNL